LWSSRKLTVKVGRGVLLDIYTWAGESYDPFTSHPITATDLIACAKAQGVKFRTGDIILVRTGWVKEYLAKSKEAKQALANLQKNEEHLYVGLEPSDEVLDFLHDNYFSAAIADSICFEVWPPKSFSKSISACFTVVKTLTGARYLLTQVYAAVMGNADWRALEYGMS
jgi:hypothetical protein